MTSAAKPGPGHEEVADWDAAYVLGALSRPDRALFEQHLADCARCRRGVVELSAMPAMLGRLDAVEVEEMVSETPVPLPPVRARPRRRWRPVVVAAAAALVLGLGTGVAVNRALAPAGTGPAPSERVVAADRTVDLRAADGIPLRASAQLYATAWGTRIDMECEYLRVEGDDSGPREYEMVAISDETEQVLTSWTAAPGESAQPVATTGLRVEEIDELQVRQTSRRRVLMSGRPA